MALPKSPLILLIAVCTLAFGLAGCGGGDGNSSSSEPAPAPSEPAPSEPVPAEPSPSEPAEPEPAPAEPVPAESVPAELTLVVSDRPVPTPESVPSGAIAVVGATAIEKTTYDELLAQREAAIVAGGGEFPAVGTPEFETLKNQAVQFIIQREQFSQEAAAVGITVSDDDLQAELDTLKEEFFEGDEELYKTELEAQSLTEKQVLADIKVRLLQDALFARITEGIFVSDDEIEAYYTENVGQFTSAESRTVAHILVADKAEADDLYQQLQDGANFAELAAANSLDTGSAENGGEYVAVRGQSVPEFEATAYEIETGTVSDPVETQFGWHIITALEDINAAEVEPLDGLRENIREILRRELEAAIVESWVEQLELKYVGKVLYAPGFNSPAADAEFVDPAEQSESP